MLARTSNTRRALAFAAAVAVGAAAVIAAARVNGDPTAILPKDAVRVNVGNAPTTAALRPEFVGLSTEFTSLLPYAGTNPDAINPTFVRLVEGLAPGASPVIRIGGDSTDWSWLPTAGGARPPWAQFVLTRRWIAVARALAAATGGRLIVGINLEADSRGLAGAEARALLGGVGRKRIIAFELGNEPEVYGEIGWYNDAAGVGVLGRPSSYGFDSYLPDYRAISSALPRSVPLAGPALALTWPLSVANRFLSANPRVRIFTFHFYPLKRCYNPRNSPTYPTLAHLMALRSAEAPPGTAAAVTAAHARGAEVRVDEVNSVSCRGLAGLSDSFASALWIVDTLFHMARAGVDGVNIHTLPDASYQPFTFSRTDGRWEARVKPIYYGLMLFGRAAPPGSRLLPTSHPPDDEFRTWATRGSRGTVRVVLINDSVSRALTLAVRPPRPVGSAALERLTAPGLTATSGVTLAGQTFGSVTTTAVLSGTPRVSALQPIQNRYVVEVPPASAALLTLRPA
jgi:Glycosyl hydrolase family 79 C-terminal beta domain